MHGHAHLWPLYPIGRIDWHACHLGSAIENQALVMPCGQICTCTSSLSRACSPQHLHGWPVKGSGSRTACKCNGDGILWALRGTKRHV